MDTYTVTFVDAGGLGISLDSDNLKYRIKEAVTKKLSQREFVLADFNWAENYDSNHIISYLYEPYQCHAVIEIRLDLDISMMNNREAIYDRCLSALEKDEVVLKRSERCTSARLNAPQYLITFDKVALKP